MNGKLTEMENVIFYVSYGTLTDKRNYYVFFKRIMETQWRINRSVMLETRHYFFGPRHFNVEKWCAEYMTHHSCKQAIAVLNSEGHQELTYAITSKEEDILIFQSVNQSIKTNLYSTYYKVWGSE